MNFPDLHRHLGGSTSLPTMWRYIQGTSSKLTDELRSRFASYSDFAYVFNRSFNDLDDYLQVHHLVENLQSEDISYFTSQAVSSSAALDAIDYLELRFNPFKRTPAGLQPAERLALMGSVTKQIIKSSCTTFPIVTTFILCMDYGFDYNLNWAILDLAATLPEVTGVDLAGSYQPQGPNSSQKIGLLREAKERGLRTTAHMAEADADDVHPELFPFLDRLGHGIKLVIHHPNLLPELAARQICLEICPMTYVRTKSIQYLSELKPVFERCAKEGVPISIGTDNPILHGNDGSLVRQYELLIHNEIISLEDVPSYAQTGYRFAFGNSK